jgi:hypothetical protein
MRLTPALLLAVPLLALAPRSARAQSTPPLPSLQADARARVAHLLAVQGELSPAAPTKTHSRHLVAGGALLTGLGVVSLVFSVVLFSRPSNGEWGAFPQAMGGVTLAHGLGCLGGGIPMIVIGQRQIPAGEPPLVLPAAPPRREAMPMGVTLGFRF